jgi:hypothetical protein
MSKRIQTAYVTTKFSGDSHAEKVNNLLNEFYDDGYKLHKLVEDHRINSDNDITFITSIYYK